MEAKELINKQQEVLDNLKEVGKFYFETKKNPQKDDVAKMSRLVAKGEILESELVKIKEQYRLSQSSVPSEEEEKSLLSTIRIKPECREIHGFEKAFQLAVEFIEKNYKLFATEGNSHRTFTLDLTIVDILKQSRPKDRISELIHHLHCESCENTFWSKEVFPDPQICDKCKSKSPDQHK